MCWGKGGGDTYLDTYRTLFDQVVLKVALEVVVHHVRGVAHHVDDELTEFKEFADLARAHVEAFGVG